MGPRHSHLAALLAAAWEAETVSAKTLTEIAHRTGDAFAKARLLVLAAYCRAHGSRLLARLSSLGQGPLPVPDDVVVGDDLAMALRRESEVARSCAARYQWMAELARAGADLSSAWVCELNRLEEEDRARELSSLAERDLHPLPAAFGGGLEP